MRRGVVSIQGNTQDQGVGFRSIGPVGMRPSSFSPAQVTGLLAWYRADLGVTLNGANVSAWADQSGTGDANKNAVQATALNQPLFTASNASYNNKPTIDFEDSELLQTGAWSVAPAQPLTVFVVGNSTNDGAARNYLFDGRGNQTAILWLPSTQTELYAGATLADADPVTSPSVVCAVFNGASSKLFISAETATATGDAGAANPTGFTIGNYLGGGTFSATGPIAEVLVYNGELGAADRGLLFDYLGARYNISIAA